MPRIVTYLDLTKAVESLRSKNHPIVTSREVKDWFDSRKEEWDDHGWNGRYLDRADDDACERGLLQKWKSGPHDNSMVGWSPSQTRNPEAFSDAETWAAKKWRKV